MERDYPDWDLDEPTADALERGLHEQAYGDLPPGSDPAAAEELIGREELTARLAGTRDKTARAWKTARDTLTRDPVTPRVQCPPWPTTPTCCTFAVAAAPQPGLVAIAPIARAVIAPLTMSPSSMSTAANRAASIRAHSA